VIARYTRPAMGNVWDDEHKLRIWLEIELLACEAQAELGAIPKDVPALLRSRAQIDPKRIAEIEQEVKHDVIAFLTNLGESVGEESRFIHLGMTSSDVLDTALAVQMRESAAILLDGLTTLKDILARRAREFKYTLMIGRTHGVHAEPITFGLKLALWYAETTRNIDRLSRARDVVSVGKISGATGTYAHLDPFVERYVCEKLGLRPAPVSTQVLQRDRHAEFLSALALCGSSLEKFATEIRHLQKTEVLEAEEPFSKGQKGSSAMPHKRNPITCERIAGLARVLRGNAAAAMENIALWHERDITHSSVERIILPDSCILLDYMVAEFTRVVRDLIVYPERMRKNLSLTHGLIHSQSLLLALTRKGMRREEAYRIVQEQAMAAWEKGHDFRTSLSANEEVKKRMTESELDELFGEKTIAHRIDYIFERVGIG
jgi:adenylosuccinate lyase